MKYETQRAIIRVIYNIIILPIIWGFGVLGFWDFGGMKRATTLIDGKQPKAWMDYMFDHTMIIAEDDPELAAFKQMDSAGVAQVRVIPGTGAEKFSEYIFGKINEFVKAETFNRVRVIKVKFMEHGKNAAYYCE